MCLRRMRFSCNCGRGSWRLNVPPERRGSHLVSMESQDQKCKASENSRVGGVSLHPFLEHPLPLWHQPHGNAPLVFMVLESFVGSCVLSSHFISTCHGHAPKDPSWSLASSWGLLALCGCLACPILFPLPPQTTLILFIFFQDSAQMYLSCEVFSTSSVTPSARLDSICTLYISSS